MAVAGPLPPVALLPNKPLPFTMSLLAERLVPQGAPFVYFQALQNEHWVSMDTVLGYNTQSKGPYL